MISNYEEKKLLNTLAIGYFLDSIIIRGEKETRKQIDECFDNAMHRVFVRKIFNKAMNCINESKKEE